MEKIETPYDQVDANTIFDVGIAVLQRQEKLYGSVFSRMAKRHTVEFVAKKIGENPPEGAEDWEWPQVKEYLQKNLEKYPYGYNALLYAMGKSEATLQGATGTSQRIGTTEVAKQMEAGEAGEVTSLADAWKQSVDKLVFFKLMPTQVSFSIEDEDTIKYVVESCPFKDSCSAFYEEDIKKSDGNPICALGRLVSSDIGQKAGAGCDYYVEKFANPECIARIKRIL